jgi:hypothetical protein
MVSWAKKTQLLPALDGLFLYLKETNNTQQLIKNNSINLLMVWLFWEISEAVKDMKFS